MRHVALEIGVPAPWDARDGVHLDERANERLGIARKRNRTQIAGGLVLLAMLHEHRDRHQNDGRPQ